MDKIRTVCIPACENHEGFYKVNLLLNWICATAVTAHRLQRDYICFEIDDDEYKAGTAWLAQECAQLSIFEIMEDKPNATNNN